MYRTVRFWDLEKFQVVSCIEEEATPVRYIKLLWKCARQRLKVGWRGVSSERNFTGEQFWLLKMLHGPTRLHGWTPHWKFIVRNRTEGVQCSQRSSRTEQGGNAVPDSPAAFLPGVCSSTQMAAACTAASRIRCVCTAGSQSAVLMWSWWTGEK